ncbi:MAG: tryptophan--tRNA ligase [Candidatus Thermoplasmatota archaeon]|nr:tryptophan--tRNA ligase [Candidatus Thermoplasmatota archaeon]
MSREEQRKKIVRELISENERLVNEFGASKIDSSIAPDFYTFRNGMIYSHRNFGEFMQRLKGGERSSIVSGLNASSSMHIAHLSVFDTNLFFQRKYGIMVYVPISDDESLVSGKVESQEEGLKKSLVLAKSILALGFDLENTRIIIDQLFPQIYNLAFSISRKINVSTVRATYGYTPDRNIGLFFYPAVQSAHVMFPNLHGYTNVLVPIGPDEDPHLRICRDVSEQMGYSKPAVIHSLFLPGTDGSKMSKSKGNAIYLQDSPKEVRKKVMNAFSGGQASVDEHRLKGGDPDVDVPYTYLRYFFLTAAEAEEIAVQYRNGKLLSGEMKSMLLDRIEERLETFRKSYEKVSYADIDRVTLKNENVDLISLCERYSI